MFSALNSDYLVYSVNNRPSLVTHCGSGQLESSASLATTHYSKLMPSVHVS